MPNLIVSTCGTSILTNETPEDLRKYLNKYSNIKQPSECQETHRLMIEHHIKQRKQDILYASDADLSKYSAEMNALLKFYDGNYSLRDMHILIHTDTWLGDETGNALKLVLEKKGFIVDKYRPRDLRTLEVGEFQMALSELAQWIPEVLSGYKKQQYRIIFNLTGGFKSIQGFMQSLAMLYADESIYIFETGKELLRLPRLPIKLDAESLVNDNFMSLRCLSLGLSYQGKINNLPETWLFSFDGQTALSPWGEVVWQEYKNKIYEFGVLPSPSEKIEYASGFLSSTEGLSKDRYVLLNQQLDKLAQHLNSNKEGVLKSLDLKAIQGVKQKGSTHEFDAWHDQDAKRVFGRLVSGCFICDRLGDALH